MKKIISLIIYTGYCGILFAQNVGIGTITPLEKLSIFTNYGYGISHEANSIKLSSYIDAGGAYIGTISNHPFHLFTNNGTAQVSLGTNGFLGLGNSLPQYRLDAAGRIRIRTGTVGNVFTSSGIWMDDYRDGDTRIFFGMQDSIRLGIWGDGTPGVGWGFNFNARNGNVGIGIQSASEKLDVAGNIKSTGIISAANYLLNTPKTYYYSMSGADFSAILSEHSVRKEFDAGGGVYMASAQTEGLVAPVHLPHGAVVKNMLVYFVDASSAIDLQVELKPNFTGGIMASISSSGSPGDSFLSDNTIADATINNSVNAYIIYARPINGNWAGNYLVLRRVVIEYTVAAL